MFTHLSLHDSHTADQFQAALTSYRSALHHTPADAVLYSNIALVQHKLGNINEVGGHRVLCVHDFSRDTVVLSRIKVQDQGKQ